MFNHHKIWLLESKVKSLEKEMDSLQNQILQRRDDIDAIAKHLGVKFEDINKRVLVKTDTPQSEP